MPEYIEREALIDYLTRPTGLRADCEDCTDVDCLDCIVEEVIRDRPAVDVAPVRHAKWEEADWVEPDCHGFETIRTPKAALRCSNCKNCFKKELLWKDNYCPNCGATMDL